MTIYACVKSGAVTQIIATVGPAPAWNPPPGIWVDVDAVSPSPMVGWTASQSGSVWTFAPSATPTPTLAEQAAAAIGAGLTVTLSGSMSLAATLFPTDPDTQQKIAAVITTLVATGAFPGGATSYPMKDSAGTWHTFSETVYKAVAGAIAAYVAALTLIIDGNPTNATALPAASVELTV